MLLKILGSIVIIAASGFLGYVFSRDCARRPQQLRELQGCLQILENEIGFMSSILTEAFAKIYENRSSEVSDFFRIAADKLNQGQVSASEAWREAVAENMLKTGLTREDEGILLAFGKLLGNSDQEGQIRNIRLTVSQLKLQEQKAEEMRKKNEAMYRNLGVLGGIAIVIVLL